MKCYWYNRWYHRRLRALDVKILMPALYDYAYRSLIRNQAPMITRSMVDKLADLAWDQHMHREKHWNCECASVETNCKD